MHRLCYNIEVPKKESVALEKFLITGGVKLKGEVTISGAKNAAVAILPATLLADGPCVIENVPNISDIAVITRILSDMGAEIRYLDKTTIEINTAGVASHIVPYEMTKQLRASSYFMGAMLGRFGKAKVSLPGGCDLGARPIDQHLKGFSCLGADCTIEHGMVNIEARNLTGSQVYFDCNSVGATINVMMAAVKASGLTVIENAAKEPHVVDMANFLNSMGADIMGAGTDVIKIRGVGRLRGACYSVIPDQIEAGTYMVAAAITRGDVLIRNVIPKHLEPIITKLERIGVCVDQFDESVRVWVPDRRKFECTSIKTMAHPGFPTDMQPQIAALLCLAEGTSIITEGIFDNRFKYADELMRMGADISVDGKVAVIQGVEALTGAPVRATDLRAGAALVLAGLAARGCTEIEDIYHIQRGYEDMEGKLRGLGARIALKRSAVTMVPSAD